MASNKTISTDIKNTLLVYEKCIKYYSQRVLFNLLDTVIGRNKYINNKCENGVLINIVDVNGKEICNLTNTNININEDGSWKSSYISIPRIYAKINTILNLPINVTLFTTDNKQLNPVFKTIIVKDNSLLGVKTNEAFMNIFHDSKVNKLYKLTFIAKIIEKPFIDIFNIKSYDPVCYTISQERLDYYEKFKELFDNTKKYINYQKVCNSKFIAKPKYEKKSNINVLSYQFPKKLYYVKNISFQNISAEKYIINSAKRIQIVMDNILIDSINPLNSDIYKKLQKLFTMNGIPFHCLKQGLFLTQLMKVNIFFDNNISVKKLKELNLIVDYQKNDNENDDENITPIFNYNIVKLDSDETNIYLHDIEGSILTHIFVPQYIKSIKYIPFNCCHNLNATFHQEKGIINLVPSFDLDDIKKYGCVLKNTYSSSIGQHFPFELVNKYHNNLKKQYIYPQCKIIKDELIDNNFAKKCKISDSDNDIYGIVLRSYSNSNSNLS
jgi:hypothetical protein